MHAGLPLLATLRSDDQPESEALTFEFSQPDHQGPVTLCEYIKVSLHGT